MGRRLIKASHQLIVGTLTNGNTSDGFIVDKGLPKDATIVDCYLDGKDVAVVFEHPSWDATEGQAPEVIDPVFYLYKWEGPYSLWSCNGCDWLGYLNDTLPCEDEPALHLCPECHETCELVTDIYVRRIKEIGMHFTSGVQLSEKTKAWLTTVKGIEFKPDMEGFDLAKLLGETEEN